MRKFIIGACAALFMITVPAGTRAQVVFFYKELPEMTIINENVEIEAFVDMVGGLVMNPVLNVKIKNKSDRTVYIDLGNTFISVNDESRSYYTPGSTSTTEGQSRGVGVNLGVISGALAGVNVGSTTSSSQTTTTFSQRVVAVPPMATKSLEKQQLIVAPIHQMGIYCDNNGLPRCYPEGRNIPRVPEGETWTFTASDDTVRFSAMVTCSFDESCAETFSVRCGYYVDRTACYKNWSLKAAMAYTEKGKPKLLKVFPEWDSWGPYFMLM